MKREATISADGRYRFDLTRTVEDHCGCTRCVDFDCVYSHRVQPGHVLWICANPSTADAYEDDPTERRMWGFSTGWGYGKMIVTNINPFRSTDPKKTEVPYSSALLLNEATIKQHAHAAALIICAWGNNALRPVYTNRVIESLRMTAPGGVLHTLGFTMAGQPKHPLYLKGSLKPQVWNP